jgi:hypothetical protein
MINDTIIHTTVLVSDPADERFATCQPPGWDSNESASRFSFSPAVCPSEWTYHQMATERYPGDGQHVYTHTTAYCCSRSGFSTPVYLT